MGERERPLLFDIARPAANIARMLELAEAQARILAAIRPLAPESVSVNAAVGRVLAERILAPIDLPHFDNSAMDGYAVRAEDVAGASPDAPVALKLVGRAPAGEMWPAPIQPGACVRIFTGSPLPPGANAVVMQEDTRIGSTHPETVWILEKVKLWENVRFRGEDVKQGTQLLASGDVLTAGALGLLAALGLKEIKVARAPVVALLSTGSELREPGEPLSAGKIYESNRTVLATLAARAGALPKISPLVPDDLEATRAALEQAFRECDAVVTTGGVSAGELDLVKLAFEQLGGQLEFWRVAIKPGKPFVFGQWREKSLFGLPGNPVSAFVTFLLLVRPALLRLQGVANVSLPAHPGMLAEPLANRGERRHFMRVKVDEKGRVRSAGVQASHILSSMAQANGLVDVPPQTTLVAGTQVQVLRWDH